MNSSLIALGVLTFLGALLLRRHIPSVLGKRWILLLAAVIAASTAATGIFPANDGTIVHWSAVLPGFVARHVVLVVIAWHFWNHHRLIALWAGVCAAAGLTGAVLLLAKTLDFGAGERFALYPLPMWMAVTGTAVLLALIRRTVLRSFDFGRFAPSTLLFVRPRATRYRQAARYRSADHAMPLPATSPQ